MRLVRRSFSAPRSTSQAFITAEASTSSTKATMRCSSVAYSRFRSLAYASSSPENLGVATLSGGGDEVLSGGADAGVRIVAERVFQSAGPNARAMSSSLW